jgi:hypothetical protein
VLSLGVLSFVLYPLFRTSSLGAAPARFLSRDPEDAARNPALEALREIEFDRETGKLSDADYNALRAEYTQRAVAVMRAGDAIACMTCGPRPESDALFCSSCGARLAA